MAKATIKTDSDLIQYLLKNDQFTGNKVSVSCREISTNINDTVIDHKLVKQVIKDVGDRPFYFMDKHTIHFKRDHEYQN
jgi:hypothetical protein